MTDPKETREARVRFTQYATVAVVTWFAFFFLRAYYIGAANG